MEYQILMTVLRLIHLTTGVFWAGGISYFAFIIIPTVAAIGPAGGPFMAQLPRTRNLPTFMTILATLNIASGLWLFWIVSDGFSMGFIETRHGMLLSFGGLLGLTAYLIGIVVNRPITVKLAAMGAAIAASGQPPTPDQMKEIGALRAKLIKATNLVATLLMSTVAMMAIMRYL